MMLSDAGSFPAITRFFSDIQRFAQQPSGSYIMTSKTRPDGPVAISCENKRGPHHTRLYPNQDICDTAKIYCTQEEYESEMVAWTKRMRKAIATESEILGGSTLATVAVFPDAKGGIDVSSHHGGDTHAYLLTIPKAIASVHHPKTVTMQALFNYAGNIADFRELSRIAPIIDDLNRIIDQENEIIAGKNAKHNLNVQLATKVPYYIKSRPGTPFEDARKQLVYVLPRDEQEYIATNKGWRIDLARVMPNGSIIPGVNVSGGFEKWVPGSAIDLDHISRKIILDETAHQIIVILTDGFSESNVPHGIIEGEVYKSWIESYLHQKDPDSKFQNTTQHIKDLLLYLRACARGIRGSGSRDDCTAIGIPLHKDMEAQALLGADSHGSDIYAKFLGAEYRKTFFTPPVQAVANEDELATQPLPESEEINSQGFSPQDFDDLAATRTGLEKFLAAESLPSVGNDKADVDRDQEWIASELATKKAEIASKNRRLELSKRTRGNTGTSASEPTDSSPDIVEQPESESAAATAASTKDEATTTHNNKRAKPS